MQEVINLLGELPLEVLKIYDIDNVDAEALPHLAQQFNVFGRRGWNLASTEAEKRELVKQAIELHRRAGTPYAIKLAMASVGYPNTTVQENPPLYYNGAWSYDGIESYSGIRWFGFIVTLDPVQSQVSSELVDEIVGLIEEWKNVRSQLLDLRIGNISLFSNLLLYDGAWSHDGAQTFDGERNI